ncbi:MAG: nucleoside triphosphate pyrophosphohydrolase [Deltaproteobacteria bacterium]|nr:MAG: nucleoside triphosphate pyrophosphohydrolase [Deltaproteobacteria bacterium]
MSVPRDETPSNADDLRARHGLRPGLDGLRDLMDRLLAPDGCPWDREQTLASLRPYLLEEAHEVAEAQLGDPSAHREELGDLLFQIVFQAALRSREGAFDLDDVVDGILCKMIERHPHVFGQGRAETAGDVERAWAARKRAEKSKDTDTPYDPLAGVPKGLPSLVRAYRLQEKAAAVGFDWPDASAVADKVDEEWRELREAISSGARQAIEEEFGDLLFVLVRLAQKLGIDPDVALARSTEKFQRRFRHVVETLHAAGKTPEESDLAEMERAWDDAKRRERASPPDFGGRDDDAAVP